MLLSELIDRFLYVDRAPTTNKAYAQTSHRFMELVGDKNISDIEAMDIERFIHSLREQTGRYNTHPLRPQERGYLSNATVERHYKTIKTLFSFAVRRDYLLKSPVNGVSVKKYRRADGESKAIRKDHLRKLIEYRCGDPRDYAILLMLTDTGCRVGGLATLRISAINQDHLGGWATITEKGQKKHKIFWGCVTNKALNAWLDIRPDCGHDFAFTSIRDREPMTPGAISRMIWRTGRKCELSKPVGPHAIRHLVGQAWSDAQANIELIRLKLGHSDSRITMEYYLNQDFERLRAASLQNALIALQ